MLILLYKCLKIVLKYSTGVNTLPQLYKKKRVCISISTKCSIFFSPNAVKCSICCCTKLISTFTVLHKKDRHVVKLLFIFFQVKNKQNKDTDNEIMNRFLYSGNLKLSLPLPRHVKSFLSLKPCLAFGRTLNAHAYTHSYNLGVPMS